MVVVLVLVVCVTKSVEGRVRQREMNTSKP